MLLHNIILGACSFADLGVQGAVAVCLCWRSWWLGWPSGGCAAVDQWLGCSPLRSCGAGWEGRLARVSAVGKSVIIMVYIL